MSNLKNDLLLKYNDLLREYVNCSVDDQEIYFASCRGFISALYELPIFSSDEVDEILENLHSIRE